MRNFQRPWIFPELLDIPPQFQNGLGGSAFFSQILFRRGLRTLAEARGFLDPAYFQPAPPSQLPGLTKAVDRILGALSSHQNILIWGDFDVDGQTSTTVLSSALSGLGSKVSHYIPNRSRESHGVSLESFKDQVARCSPALVLTCDTGVDAFEAVAYAQSSDIDVIITDHHQLPEELPPAYSVINPNLVEENHPLFNLPGVGVAYKLIEALYFRLDKNPEQFLDLVALGIVADVARQTGDVRYLLQKGQESLRQTERLGLQNLLATAGIKPEEISEETIGYVIGPRLNALGRLDDANSCVEFFTTSSPARAAELAAQLENLNTQRQQLTESIFQDSLTMLSEYPEYDRDYPILVLQGSAHWHPGVIGIVASRLVERYHKPVIMLAQEGKIARGSARSISGVPISALLSETADLLLSHGGHPMAAGMSLKIENVPHFRRSLAENYSRIVGGPPEPPAIVIDTELPFQQISEPFIKDFQRLAPFGPGNPRLLFATRSVQLNPRGIKIIGKDRNHKKITLFDSAGAKQDFLWWNSAGIELPPGAFDVAYSLDLTTFRGQAQIQATLRHFRESPGLPVLINKTAPVELVDYRKYPDPRDRIIEISSTRDVIIWSELNTPEGINSVKRSGLVPSKTLVIWTTPPSDVIYKRAVEQVQPTTIVFFALDPKVQTIRSFTTKLLGVLKSYNKGNQSQYDSQLFAESIAVTPALIEAGLEWIHQHGDYDLSAFQDNGEIKPGPRKNREGFPEIDLQLKIMLKEIAAYRTYFQHAKLETLL